MAYARRPMPAKRRYSPAEKRKRLETSLRRRFRYHLNKLGMACEDESALTKDAIRHRHSDQRRAKLKKSRNLIELWPEFARYFANGSDVSPTQIRPRLELVDGDTWHSQLFALASLYWSVPTSAGYGRRLRFLCWDDNTDCLIGIVALGDPVFNLGARDRYIGWNGDDRRERLWSVMDAYVLGAVPPYNALLCGKMLACLLRSTDVAEAFAAKYRNYVSIISGKRRRKAPLAMITTSSALGRSSVYNRLRLGGDQYFLSVGQTQGYGHFHIPDSLFLDMRLYLEMVGHEYANKHSYGNGPNWRLRVVREAITRIGLSPQLTQHGIAREVFVCETGANSLAYLRGEVKDLNPDQCKSASEIARLSLDRWVIPRSERVPTYREWRREDFLAEITGK